MNLANLFREAISALDRGKNRMVRFLHKENCSCCIARRGQPITVSEPAPLEDEISSQVVDADFRELSKPSELAPKSLPEWKCEKDDSELPLLD